MTVALNCLARVNAAILLKFLLLVASILFIGCSSSDDKTANEQGESFLEDFGELDDVADRVLRGGSALSAALDRPSTCLLSLAIFGFTNLRRSR